VKRSLVRVFRGRRYEVPDLEFYECPDCGERLFDRAASRMIEQHSPAFARNVRRKSA
jgi:YgiT-type zinc finger domain-containing protein